MPPLAIHTSIAKQMADRLSLPDLDGQRGNVYLGSTAPDIRVITRWERQRTHYFDIHNFGEQSSLAAFFQNNPALSESGNLDERTRAFLAGYLSHLVVDEMWIGAIYRPFFGERSPLGGSLRANVMDRALQFSLDADTRSDADFIAHLTEAVAGCDLDLDIDFIDRETLDQWHGIITDFVHQQPDWDRFRERVRAHLSVNGDLDEAEYIELAQSLPDIVDETLRYLSRTRIDDVINESLDACVKVVMEYLECE